MPATTKPKTVIIGGFHRVHVGDDGEIVGSLSFTKACLEGGFSEGPGAMLIVTQLVGATPTEVHVFNSLTHRIPIIVVADSGYRIVEGVSIRRYDPGP